MKTILVPTDFSPLADHALQVAVAIARRIGAQITLMHVVEIPAPVVSTTIGDPIMPIPILLADEFKEQWMVDARKKLKEITSDIRYAGVQFNTLLESEITSLMPVDVADFAIRPHADLIVMGSHGASGFKELMLGSQAEKIVRHAKCPVLIIKNQIKDFQLRKLAYATDFLQDRTHSTNQLKKLADLFSSEIQLLFVSTPLSFQKTRYVLKNMRELAKKYHLENFSFHPYTDYSEEAGILHFAEDNESDVIVLTTEGKAGLSHLLNGSVSEDVVNHAQKPVLVLTNKV